jgi:hypothetical protein
MKGHLVRIERTRIGRQTLQTMKTRRLIPASLTGELNPDNSFAQARRKGSRVLAGCAVLPALFCLSLFVAANVHAQDEEFSIQFATVGGGGSAGSSEEFSLNAGVGQWEAGTSSSDEFSTEGGFWNIVAALQPPILTIVPAGPGQVTIFWTPELDYVLQETSSLSQPGWTDSPSGGTNYVTISITDSVKFYRLRSR